MTPDEFEEFRALVETDDRHTELECAKYLHFAADLLFPKTAKEFLFSGEERNYYGATDFVASARLSDDRGLDEDVCTIWELKSPQTYLFEYDDNKNRCRPTSEFIKAENQLIHYSTLAMGDQDFRRRFGILDQRNIRPGGLIIGRAKDRFLKAKKSDADEKKAVEALNIRENFFYRLTGIRLLTWDRVLAFVRPQT